MPNNLMPSKTTSLTLAKTLRFRFLISLTFLVASFNILGLAFLPTPQDQLLSPFRRSILHEPAAVDQADGLEVENISLHLIGERHSGTNWMSTHLQTCFPNVTFSNNLHRWKHWFQQDSEDYFPGNRLVVVAMFRNPLGWISAMKSWPHHACDHFDLDWQEFVARPWSMAARPANDAFENWTADTTRQQNASYCPENPNLPHQVDKFYPHQVVPCKSNRRRMCGRRSLEDTYYELRNDGSGQPYDNILDLRQAKIENHLSVANFTRVQDFIVVRYEDAKMLGTADLVRQLEQSLGITAECVPEQGMNNFHDRVIEDDRFQEYLKQHVHWETEAKIGIGYYVEEVY